MVGGVEALVEVGEPPEGRIGDGRWHISRPEVVGRRMIWDVIVFLGFVTLKEKGIMEYEGFYVF